MEKILFMFIFIEQAKRGERFQDLTRERKERGGRGEERCEKRRGEGNIK